MNYLIPDRSLVDTTPFLSRKLRVNFLFLEEKTLAWRDETGEVARELIGYPFLRFKCVK